MILLKLTETIPKGINNIKVNILNDFSHLACAHIKGNVY